MLGASATTLEKIYFGKSESSDVRHEVSQDPTFHEVF